MLFQMSSRWLLFDSVIRNIFIPPNRASRIMQITHKHNSSIDLLEAKEPVGLENISHTDISIIYSMKVLETTRPISYQTTGGGTGRMFCLHKVMCDFSIVTCFSLFLMCCCIYSIPSLLLVACCKSSSKYCRFILHVMLKQGIWTCI